MFCCLQRGFYLHVSAAEHGGYGRGDNASARAAVSEQDHVPGLPALQRTGNNRCNTCRINMYISVAVISCYNIHRMQMTSNQ